MKPATNRLARVVEDFLRGAHLLNHAVLHDDDAVAQRHGLGLVMGNIDEGGIRCSDAA